MISNKVFTANARCRLDLWSDALLTVPQYRQPRGRFPGAVLKLESATFLIFASGKIVVTGLKTEPDELEFEMITDIRLFDIQLSHCSGYMHVGPVCIATLRDQTKGEWEPELHPGLLFKLGNVSVSVYSSGTVMYCGCRSLEHAAAVECKVHELINSVRY